jgi:hypothetical protein
MVIRITSMGKIATIYGFIDDDSRALACPIFVSSEPLLKKDNLKQDGKKYLSGECASATAAGWGDGIEQGFRAGQDGFRR